MIVRDEELTLRDCLGSAKGLCDEMVVVDTGSVDGTVAVAEAAGARVYHFPWCDDFSAARNESIRHATCDWLLILDADERLGRGSIERLRETISHDDFDCGMLNLHDAISLEATPEDVLSGKARMGDTMLVPRLLRRTEDAPFSGIVHESVRPWLLRHGNRVRYTGADLVHYGAVPEHRVERSKAQRNTKLLEKRARMEPDDFTIHGYLAHEYLGANELEKAWEIAERGWALVEKASPDTLRSALRLAAARAMLQFKRNDAEGVLETVRVTTAYEGRQPDLDFFAARAHEMLAGGSYDPAERVTRLDLAEKAYLACLTQNERIVGQRYVRGARSWATETRLATVRLIQGRPKEALAGFERSLAANDDVPETHYGLAEAYLESGQAARALELIEPHLDDAPDPWLVAASCFDELNRLEDFKFAAGEARKRSQEGSYVAPHRNRRHGTVHCQLLCYLGKPSRARGCVGAAAAIMGGEVPLRTPTIIEAGDRRILMATMRNLLLRGHERLVERLLTPEAEKFLPGVTGLLREVIEALGMSIDDTAG